MYTPAFEDHAQDFLAVLQWTKQQHPHVPCFVFGESYGGVYPIGGSV